MQAETGRVAPTRDDAVVQPLSEVVGGPLGEHAGRHSWWSPWRVIVLLAALTFAVGLVQKAPCYSTEWSDSNLRYDAMCYSDLPYLYTGRGFAEDSWPYSPDAQVRERYPEVMEYPVGISYWAYGTAHLTHLIHGTDLDARAQQPVDELWSDPQVRREAMTFVAVNAVGMAALTMLAAWFLVGVNPRRPWDAAGFALAPALALTGIVNWDMLAVVLVAGALWAWARGRPLLTGVMIGLGTAAKLYPVFLLGGILILAIRYRRWRAFVLASVAAAVTWAAANWPAYRTGPEQWGVFWTFNSERAADLGSLWLVVSQAADITVTPHTINVGSWAFFGAWCLAVLALGLLATTPPRLAQLGFLIVAGFLLVNKVYSPQYVLWLLPLAALARPRWRDLLIWQAGEVFYFAAVWWYLGGDLEGGGSGVAATYWIAVVLRVMCEVYLVVVIVRDILWPRYDPVDRVVVESSAPRPRRARTYPPVSRSVPGRTSSR